MKPDTIKHKNTTIPGHTHQNQNGNGEETTTNEIIIISGANGSGKTTFARSYSKDYPSEYVNTDEMARELAKENAGKVKLQAGRLFFKKVDELLEAKNNFLVESTLSGKYLLKLIKKAREKGFFVKIIYMFMENPYLCIERIKERVLKGGHNVPDEDVIRRYYRSKNNFWHLYKNLGDEWFLMYNADYRFSEIALGSGEDYVIRDQKLFKEFLKDLQDSDLKK